MQMIDIIQESIRFIEVNLKTELTAEDIANQAGFSLFHYYRIFQVVVGLPVMQYVQNRRLQHAIYEISCGAKMIDTALAYGFETHAGFFKAFRREYDCSPSQYVKNHIVKKPYPINLKQEAHKMITHKKLKEVLTHWGLENEKIATFYYESSGVKSDSSWYIGEDYFLKSGNNLTALKQHIAIAKTIQKSGFETTIPVATKDGKDYLLDGETYFCLTLNPKGECVVAKNMYEPHGMATARYIGEILGQLHKTLQKHDKELICDDNNLFNAVKDWALPEVKKVLNLPEEFFKDYLQTFGKLYPAMTVHVIHRNPTPSDFVSRDGKPVGFIEFEMSERNIRLFDPCYAATAILSESFSENDADNLNKWVSIFKNILYGYDSVCKLTKEEKKAVPYVVFSIQMICVAYFSGMEKYAELAKTNQKMLKWLHENKEQLQLD